MNAAELDKIHTIIQKELANRRVYESADGAIAALKSLVVFEKELKESIEKLKKERDKLADNVSAQANHIEKIKSDSEKQCQDKEIQADAVLAAAKGEAKAIIEKANAEVDQLKSTKLDIEGRIKALLDEKKAAEASKAILDKSIEETKKKLSGFLE